MRLPSFWPRVRFITPGRKVSRRDYWLGIANGAIFGLAESLSDANLVLTLYVRALGAPLALVGLLPSIKNGGWLLPQLLAAGRLQAQHRVIGVYRRAALVRWVMWLLLTLTVFSTELLGPGLAVGLFLLCYAIYSLSGGASSLAFQEIVAKVIPPARRGSFFGYRNLFGGLLAFLIAGPIVRVVLSQQGPLEFPNNYGLLMALALGFITIALISFAIVNEPRAEQVAQRQSAGAMLRHIPELLRGDPGYARFIGVRLLGRLGAIAEPFYVIYAREVLHVPVRMIGIYLATRTVGAALSNLYWNRVADRQGPQALLAQTGALALLVPLAALLLPAGAGLLGLDAEWLGWAYAAVFLLAGLSADGNATGGMTYVMDYAPPGERPAYIGVANTLLGIATFLPVLGGLLIEVAGYQGVMLLGVAASIAAWRMTLGLSPLTPTLSRPTGEGDSSPGAPSPLNPFPVVQGEGQGEAQQHDSARSHTDEGD